MDDSNSIILTYINPQTIEKILELLVINNDTGFKLNECCVYRIFDIISLVIKIQSNEFISSLMYDNTEITQLIINKILYISYLYLQNGFISEYIYYLNNIMKIESILSYTNQNNYGMCKYIFEFTDITEYNLNTIICIKIQLFEQNIFELSDHIIPITITNLISTNKNKFELLFHNDSCSYMTIRVDNSYSNNSSIINIIQSNDKSNNNYINYPICEYWDFNFQKWIYIGTQEATQEPTQPALLFLVLFFMCVFCLVVF